MDNITTLNSTEANAQTPFCFDFKKRFEYLSAVEYATGLMVGSLESYLEINGEAPENIFIESNRYQPSVCLSILKSRINKNNLKTKITLTDGSYPNSYNSLIFNLDEMADEYFKKSSPEKLE